jgi:SpoVK/Ycf46/Vps4 family AAA+-type ATPase
VPTRLPPSLDDVRDLEILVRAHHPVIVLEADEAARASTLVRWVGDRLGLTFFSYRPDQGLVRPDMPAFSAEGTQDPLKCLDFVLKGKTENLYFLNGFASRLEDEAVQSKLLLVAEKLFEHRGAVFVPCTEAQVPAGLERFVSTFRLSSPSAEQYYQFVKEILEEVHARMPLRVKLSSGEVSRLLNQLRGLTLFEVKKILTKMLVEDNELTAEDIPKIAEAKKQIIERSGVLEYFSAHERMTEIAGLNNLKSWLGKRKVAFTDPDAAKRFGLVPPRGILLLGVQGCGKSLCAKAIASEWGLPLVRLDPSSLYNKYFGESEKNLKRATRTAEQLAPVVLWIDEMEKAFAQGEQQDSGTSTRIFGSFLHWMQEKQPGVFVIATCNDITKLPPELVRKGRFDEIFFVDLPNAEIRATILAVHLTRRQRDPARYDLARLAELTEGFSGAELEQVVLSALYNAFASRSDLAQQHLEQEIGRTVPLAETASEKIEALRTWSIGRTVPAD